MASFKADRYKQNLVVYDGKKIGISMFNKKIAIVDTQMSKIELFIKQSNYTMY